MNEILFNALFDRKIHNPDFLRGRIASCIKPISDYISANSSGNYYTDFYISTINFNDNLIKHFGINFIDQTISELFNLKNFLFDLFNSNNIILKLKENKYLNLLTNYYKLTKYCGFSKRSRILRRYFNFIRISNNLLNGKISVFEYKKELLNHIVFFDEMLKNFQNVLPDDICIYYFAFDIRASENIRKLKSQINKISL